MKKVTTTTSPIELNIFAQMLEVSPEIMLELIETVGTAAMLNPHLALSSQHQLAAAASLLSFGSSVFEQNGCKLDITITNPSWTDSSKYKTGEKYG